MKFIVYATGDNGNGFVMTIGEYESLMFANDVVITISYEEEDKG